MDGLGATPVYELAAGPFGSRMDHSHHNATEQDGLLIRNDALGGFAIDGKGIPATAPYTAKLGQRIRFGPINKGQTGMSA